MPRHNTSPGDHVDITLRGYVVYNAGGYLAITDSKKLVERFRSAACLSEKVKVKDGEAYFDIPEYMIVQQPVDVPEYSNGTLARMKVTTPHSSHQTLVLEFVVSERHPRGVWCEPNDHGVFLDPIVIKEIEIIYDPENQ